MATISSDEALATKPATGQSAVEDVSIAMTHPDYDENVTTWEKCRDVIEGSDEVKEKGELYLPKLPGHDDPAYKDYKMRAMFYGAVKRTIKGMSGMVFMRDPAVENVPKELEAFLNDITFTGVPLAGFSKMVFGEVVGMGRAGILVDMPKVGAPEQRPYLLYYTAEQILNWREERRDGRMVTTLVVLQELYEEPDPSDMYVMTQYNQYRVLDLMTVDPVTDQPLATPQYRMRVYREQQNTENKKAGYWLQDYVIPVKNGEPLDFIPFVPVGPEENTFRVQQPPVLDMVEVVLSHYRTSADLENGRHWCGTPQPWLAGFPDKPSYQIGGDQIWLTTEPTAKAEMLEFKGTGLGALEKALEEKESKLAVLGMRLLETQRKGQEQPEALRLRMLGDVSTLAGIVQTVSQAISKAVKWAVGWATTAPWTGDAEITLNKDYDEMIITAQDIQTLVTLWQNEGISYKTLYSNLERGKMARAGVSPETELEEIQTEREEREKLAREANPNYDEMRNAAAMAAALRKGAAGNQGAGGADNAGDQGGDAGGDQAQE